MRLPDHPHSVGTYCGISRYQIQILDLCLRDQHPIKWIPV
jgi:hypothetical protein